MKSNLLYTAVAFVVLAGILSAQSVERRVPGYNSYPGVTVNNVTAAQLTQWMRSSSGSTTATVDRWCYAMSQVVTGGYMCPAPENFGFTGAERNSPVDAQTFLKNLRLYQTGANTPPYARGEEGPVGASPGIAACQDAVRDRLRTEGYNDVRISSINTEDRPRGADRVYGSAEAEGQRDRHERFDFSCNVNLERGEVRSLDVNPR